MNCSLVPQTLASDVHHGVLSAYLNYNQKKSANSLARSQAQSVAKRIERKLAQEASRSSGEANLDAEATAEATAPLDQNSKPTFLVDSPDDLNNQDPEASTPPNHSLPAEKSATAATPDSLPSQLEETDQPATTPPPSSSDTPPLPGPTLILATETHPTDVPPTPSAPADTLPLLEINAKHLSDPVEVLATLNPADLLQELLGRVLLGGIGRLYLERQHNYGRILWSQNGVLQSVLEELPLEVLQGAINELKLMTRLPLIPVQKPKQVEIERIYQRHRLLLRLRVMPGNYGEEATVQVLRGAALKFYQQQQLASLSRDALGIAQDLQRKVNEIRVRTRFYPIVSQDQLDILPALSSVIKNVEQQLESLKNLQLVEVDDEDDE